jgi:hypothetical protein
METTLGMLPTVPMAGTLPLMQCRVGGDVFSSTDAGCEGQQVLARSGYVYTDPPAGQPALAIYRCTTGDGEHFDSTDAGCEGQHTEGRLGYTEAKATLTRYFSIYGDHDSTTGVLPLGYFYEGTLGVIPTAPVAGTVPLMRCRVGPDTFTSTDPGCEGQQVVARSGYVYTDPPAGQAAIAIYRCTAPDGEHFDSPDAGCEGQHTEGRLGYTLIH